MRNLSTATPVNSLSGTTGTVFAGMWLVTFAIYFPAANAGFVADFTGWLDETIRSGFWDNINRTHYKVRSLYQFTQFNTWLFYQLFGANTWAWHLLFVTLHALNCGLLYKLCRRLLVDAGVGNSAFISIFGVLLFCIAPHASEVVVWEPSFHYLQGLLLILLILNWCASYIHTASRKYIWFAGIAYFLSTFSLEIFYITPWLTLVLILFYKYIPRSAGLSTAKRSLFWLFLPQVSLFLAHLVLFRVAYGSWVAHISNGGNSFDVARNLGKPAKHLFHILFLGRFFSDEVRRQVYALCDSTAGIVLFYGCVVIVFGIIVFRWRSLSGKARMSSLLFIWSMITLALLIPLWFGDLQLVIYDRYTYFTNAFVYMLVAVLASYVRPSGLRVSIIGLYVLVNLRFTIQLSRYWMKSERIIASLLRTFPDDTGKTVILLNLPQNMHGASMIGAEHESEFKLMHDLLLPGKKIQATVYDGMAYNMLTPDDGAHVMVLNDSTLKVTLNQWGTWWWFGMQGGTGYENSDYRLDMKDPGHYYELTLKKTASQYLILYQVGQEWKTADMSKRDAEQY